MLNHLFKIGLGFCLITILALPAAAHNSINTVEDAIQERDKYVQFIRQDAPDFQLHNLADSTVNLADYSGKVVILNFIYSRCREECTLHSRRIAEVQQQIATAKLTEQVQFISIATDTEDATATADVMRKYGSHHGLDPTNWLFLYGGEGREQAGIEVARSYGLVFTPEDDGSQMHSVVTYVIDTEGTLVGRYHGLKFKPISLTSYAAAVAHGNHTSQTKLEINAPSPLSKWSINIAFGLTSFFVGGLIYLVLSFCRRNNIAFTIGPRNKQNTKPKPMNRLKPDD